MKQNKISDFASQVNASYFFLQDNNIDWEHDFVQRVSALLSTPKCFSLIKNKQSKHESPWPLLAEPWSSISFPLCCSSSGLPWGLNLGFCLLIGEQRGQSTIDRFFSQSVHHAVEKERSEAGSARLPVDILLRPDQHSKQLNTHLFWPKWLERSSQEKLQPSGLLLVTP